MVRRLRRISIPRLLDRCRDCGGLLISEGTQVLDKEKAMGAKILIYGGDVKWSGQKLFAVWRCRKCGQVWLKEAKELGKK